MNRFGGHKVLELILRFSGNPGNWWFRDRYSIEQMKEMVQAHPKQEPQLVLNDYSLVLG